MSKFILALKAPESIIGFAEAAQARVVASCGIHAVDPLVFWGIPLTQPFELAEEEVQPLVDRIEVEMGTRFFQEGKVSYGDMTFFDRKTIGLTVLSLGIMTESVEALTRKPEARLHPKWPVMPIVEMVDSTKFDQAFSLVNSMMLPETRLLVRYLILWQHKDADEPTDNTTAKPTRWKERHWFDLRPRKEDAA